MVHFWASLATLLWACSVVAVLLGQHQFLWVTIPAAALFLYQTLGARRYCFAVGEGWILFRSEPFGGGWTTFDRLQSTILKEPTRGIATLQLQGPSFRARMALSFPALTNPSKLNREIARQVLEQDLELHEDVREVLEVWAAPAAGRDAQLLRVRRSGGLRPGCCQGCCQWPPSSWPRGHKAPTGVSAGRGLVYCLNTVRTRRDSNPKPSDP